MSGETVAAVRAAAHSIDAQVRELGGDQPSGTVLALLDRCHGCITSLLDSLDALTAWQREEDRQRRSP